MNGNCLDIGTIQAFLDGELASDVSMSVAGHVGECDSCSLLLAQAEEESAFVFPVLEREMTTLVPTQRLWTRINESIAVEKENTPFWKKIWALVAVSIANPSIAVAASVLIVFGVFAAVYSVLSEKNTDERFVAAKTQDAAIPAVNLSTPPEFNRPVTGINNRIDGQKAIAARADHRKIDSRAPTAKGPDRVNAEGYLPGEESYVKTIANLSQTVAGQKDIAMRPSQRVSYERDLAVVDDSIKRMRSEVRKNPKNESAKQVLYSSYQNKIDLLNSVAQKEELMASLK